jgi:UDP-sulfoquinovose synthase
MRILITGGDGFIGWPLTLRLSSKGHQVMIVDNGLRRRLARSLTPIAPLADRLLRWHERTPYDQIECYTHDVDDHERMQVTMEDFCPEAVIHLAVQPSAPYSMRSLDTKMETVTNNVLATTALLSTAVELEEPPHIIHIGTMGVYGYGAVPGATIPEGYIDVTVDGVSQSILHPTSPGSLYHATKVVDQTLFAFFARNHGIRITDLHQGIVWGTQTPETRQDDTLINRFDYDGDFGTVLNRFLMQAAIGYPLTVHGTGGQTRAFININDSIACLELALANPPKAGERVRIMNQMTETHRVIDLAAKISTLTGAEVNLVDNPRREAAENGLIVENRQLRELGLHPTLLTDDLMVEEFNIAARFRSRADKAKIKATANWGRAA